MQDTALKSNLKYQLFLTFNLFIKFYFKFYFILLHSVPKTFTFYFPNDCE